MIIKNYCVYEIEIKNINVLKKQLKNNLKIYNKEIYKYYLNDILKKVVIEF